MNERSNAVIETTKLSKEFRDFWGRVKAKALDNLELTVQQGEIFGLLGPNGSGKTTTIKLLLGLLFPSGGTIKVFGNSPRHVANKQRIGFLPEESYLYPYHNAEEALFFYGRLFGLSREICHKRVEELLEMVGLFKIRKRPIKEYSKGMARRIGLAQALINDPELVFLDEPTSGLDPIATHEVKDLILQLKKHGKTIVLSSHLLADVEDICDRIAILYGGKIQAQGVVGDLLSKPSATQITLENLPQPLRQQLVSWFGQNNIRQVSFSTPRERLETFFLRVVEAARQRQVVTSGAEAGKSLETFFSDAPVAPATTPKHEIIAQLLKTDHPAVTSAPAQPEQMPRASPQPAAENIGQIPAPVKLAILDKLVVNKHGETTPEINVSLPDKDKAREAEKSHAVKGLLDKLLRPGGQKKEQQP
jgi:ABC-2 type transport system ATP-binding protein